MSPVLNTPPNVTTKTVGVDLLPPFGVYVNGDLQATYTTLQEALEHYRRIVERNE